MAPLGKETEEPEVQGGVFATTHWSVVLAAGQNASPQAAQALETLCRTYWYPLYAYVRRRGYGPEDAQDLTQEFFALFLRKEYFRLANRARGRFRTFLLHAIEHFLINEWKRAQCGKRGGGTTPLSLDVEAAEQRYANEPAVTLTPERAYEKQWAATLLEHVLSAVKQEYAEAGNTQVFEAMADLLWGKDGSASFAEIGARLGMTEGAARGAMHRLRTRYRERLRREVAQTVAEPGEVDQELRYLISVVSQQD
jgi:RNA polymerase sigma-70 factor (ECF subfamily)